MVNMGSTGNYMMRPSKGFSGHSDIWVEARSCLMFLKDQKSAQVQLARRKTSLDGQRITMMSDSTKNRIFHRENLPKVHRKLIRSNSEPIVRRPLPDNLSKPTVAFTDSINTDNRDMNNQDGKIINEKNVFREKLCKQNALDLSRIDEIVGDQERITTRSNSVGKKMRNDLYVCPQNNGELLSISPKRNGDIFSRLLQDNQKATNKVSSNDQSKVSSNNQSKVSSSNQSKVSSNQLSSQRRHKPLSRTVSAPVY